MSRRVTTARWLGGSSSSARSRWRIVSLRKNGASGCSDFRVSKRAAEDPSTVSRDEFAAVSSESESLIAEKGTKRASRNRRRLPFVTGNRKNHVVEAPQVWEGGRVMLQPPQENRNQT